MCAICPYLLGIRLAASPPSRAPDSTLCTSALGDPEGVCLALPWPRSPLHGHFPVGGLGWLHNFHFHQHGMISDSHTLDLGGRSVMWVGSWVGISF